MARSVDRPETKKPVPRQRRAFSTLGGPVEVGGEAASARLLRKLLDVDPAAARALTHGFHSYAGRMHPSIARGAIADFSAPGDTVVDPFCGSGTVLVEANGLFIGLRPEQASRLFGSVHPDATDPQVAHD